MYTIHLCNNAKPVIHASHRCPITMCPLVYEKLDEFLEQIIVPVTEPTDWVSSLTYSWKANGKLWVCLDPKDLNAAICHDHYHTQTLVEITHEVGGSTCFTKLDGTSSYLCVILDYESSLLMKFKHPIGTLQICLSPLRPCLCPGHLSVDDGPNPGMLWSCNWDCR